MRAAGRRGRTVVLRLRFDDFSRATRSHTMLRPTAETQAILAAARDLLGAASPEIGRRGLTLIGIAVTNLGDERTLQEELPLWAPGWSALDAALDEVRDRYGADAIKRGVLLGRDPGITMPLLPD
jgi:DNA polymerase-4